MSRLPRVAGIAVLFLVLLNSGARAAPNSSTAAGCLPRLDSRDPAYALLADNQLAVASAEPGDRAQLLRLGGSAQAPAVGHYLALARGNTLFVLVPRSRDDPAKLVRLDVSTGCVIGSRSLGTTAFHAIAIGPRTQRIYLAGNRSTSNGIGSAVVSVFDRLGRRSLATHAVRRVSGWLVYDTAISPDESRLYVSYHGPSTQGADVLQIVGRKLERCLPPTRSRACMRLHGAVEARGSRLLATAGEPPYVLELRANGKLVRRFDSGLRGNHLMEFALDQRQGRLFAIGSCGYSGGLSRLDLNSATITLFGYPAPRAVDLDGNRQGICGERISVGSALVTVAKTQRPVPAADRRGQLLFVAAEDGELAHSVPLPSEPVDVLSVSLP